jgi:L-threonylcarbamoyladenylate synthase
VDGLDEAVAVLRRGGLVAFPTETVYGLGAAARDPAAIRRIFDAKGRPADHPVIVHVRGAADLDRWAIDIPELARSLARRFWPGPLTLVLRRHPDVPLEVTGGQDTIALRAPDHPVALALLEAFGDGIAAPSANRFGDVSPTTAAHVALDLGDRVDLILDGGPCVVGIESTIVDLTGSRPRLLRPGGLPLEALEAAIGDIELAPRVSPRAPGTLPSHYAPRARVVVVAEEDLLGAAAAHRGAAVLGPRPIPGHPHVLLPEDATAAARRLYAALREADEAGYGTVLVPLPKEAGLGRAIGDRLRRAAAPREGG